ncbi:MAG: prolyl aminopeptidase [Pseudomonadota bacterium]
MTELKGLYAPTEPYRTGKLAVSELHTIYFEECGNPNGKPVVVLHGGPGGGATPAMRRFFDPSVYRIVLFDQRGCGRSTPHACLEDNTTWALVDDIEALRVHLEIDRWQVFGGSWGSTLALVYAQSHPERVTELVLRGIFTLRQSELRWFYQDGGASWMYPDAWERFIAPIPADERGDFIKAYYARLTHEDRAVQVEAARAWSAWEGGTVSLFPSSERIASFSSERFSIAFARIECHYFINSGFFNRDNHVLSNVDKIRDIPGEIAQGRYDVVTPMKTAWELAKAWPAGRLTVCKDAGHAASEPAIVDALVRATDRFR